jgi:hypothetical protein
MSDIQLAILFVAVAAIFWYVRSGLERASGPSGVLAAPAAPRADAPVAGLRWLLLFHAANLICSVPLLARPPFSLDEGHSMSQWLAEFLTPWLRWVGLTQLIYVGPLWNRLRGKGRPAEAKALALAGGLTLALSILCWSAVVGRDPASPISLQAVCGMTTLVGAVAMLWLARELRRSLKD